MGLRCSLLGHDYGEPDVEREREERGNEVVITIRELETCTHCGAESVVSENTEVRPIGPPPSTAGPDGESDPPTAGTDGVTSTGASDTGDAEDARDGAPSADVGGTANELDAPPADADDGVILDSEDDEAAEAERSPGEWPSASDTRLEETGAPADESARPDREERPDEGVSVDEGGAFTEDAAANGASDAGGATEHDDASDGAELVEFGPGDATGITRAESADIGGEASPNAELVCPSCNFEETSLGSSHRAGDICPECREGYLSER